VYSAAGTDDKISKRQTSEETAPSEHVAKKMRTAPPECLAGVAGKGRIDGAALLTHILSCFTLESKLLIFTDGLAEKPRDYAPASSSSGNANPGNKPPRAGLSLRCKNRMCCAAH
jgi:hypothetical protein